MAKRKNEEDEVEDIPSEPSNANELMSVIQPFISTQYARDIVDAVKDGRVDPLKAMTVIKRFEKVAKLCLKDKKFRELAINQLEKFLVNNTKSVDLYSANISKGATYTEYDFKACGHPVLDALYEIQKTIEDEIANIEDELKLMLNKKQDEPKEGEELDLGIVANTKQIVVDKIPLLKWEATDDIATVEAPKKYQTIGMKFNKV